MRYKRCCKNKRLRKIPLRGEELFQLPFYHLSTIQKYHIEEQCVSRLDFMTISHTSLASRCSLARWRDLLLLFVDMTRAKARISRDHFRVVSFCLLLLLLLRLAVCGSNDHHQSSFEDKEALLIFLGFVRPIALLPQILNFFAKWFSSRPPPPSWWSQQQPLQYEEDQEANEQRRLVLQLHGSSPLRLMRVLLLHEHKISSSRSLTVTNIASKMYSPAVYK